MSDLFDVASCEVWIVCWQLRKDQRTHYQTISFDSLNGEQTMVDGSESRMGNNNNWEREECGEARHVSLSGDRNAPSSSPFNKYHLGSFT
jgi:hypothetical protein